MIIMMMMWRTLWLECRLPSVDYVSRDGPQPTWCVSGLPEGRRRASQMRSKQAVANSLLKASGTLLRPLQLSKLRP